MHRDRTLPASSKDSILASLTEHERQIRSFGVQRIGLFGSFARGSQTTASDIDFLVEFDPGQKTFDNFIRLSFFLEDLFQRRVELVTPESISPYLRPYIIKEVEYVPIAS
jgi:hypothetical protein